MRILGNSIAGAAGLAILLGALAATPTTTYGSNPAMRAGQIAETATGPDLGQCPRLEVEAGNKLAFHTYADGVQIYRWSGTAWDFVAPDAVLFADAEGTGEVGTHYAGPTWESNSGSKVIARVLERCPTDPTAIPALKLEAVYSEGPGIFDGVTFIQRVNTVGGIAPTDPGTIVGETRRVPYTAEYYFYKAQD